MQRQQAAWLREYGLRGKQRIESSYTGQPERCIAWFRRQLPPAGPGSRLLDVGCGRGRNSLSFLRAGWRVVGLDIAPQALREFRARAGTRKGRLAVKVRSLAEPLPFPDGYFDAILEITAADNLIDLRRRNRFWRECARVLKPAGRLLSYHFTPQDGYYGPLLRVSPGRNRGYLFDPRAGMHFRYYTARDIVAASARKLRLRRTKHYHYPGPMFGKIYVRDLVAAVLTLNGADRARASSAPQGD